ncbi:hypothetical protein Tco_1360722 [Tanacetum coccineum]
MFNSATSPTTVLRGPSGGIYSWCSPDRMVAKSKCMIKMPWSKSMRKKISSPKSSSWSWDSFQEFSSKGGGSSGSCSSYMSFDDLLNTLESRTKNNKVSRRRSFILFSRATSSIMHHGRLLESPAALNLSNQELLTSSYSIQERRNGTNECKKNYGPKEARLMINHCKD